jgi:hypothetical protein
MSTKFEQLLDYLVNEEHEKANELFHEIVVEKSRTIYENLISEEEEEEMDEAKEEEMDESSEEEMDEAKEEEMDESSEELEDSYMMDAEDDVEADKHDFAPGDATDDLGADVMGGDDDDMGGEDDAEDAEDKAIYDIKNAIEELEAAFAELEAAQGEENDEMGMDSDFGDEEDSDDMGGDEDDDTLEMMGMHEGRRVTREYVEKVGNDWEKGSTQKAQGKAAGAGTGEEVSAPSEGKSPVSSGKGKPTTGADAKNIAQGAVEGQHNTGTTPNKVNKGITPEKSEKFAKENGNVPGGKMGVKNLKKQSGWPQNNKTPGPVGSGSGDKAGQTSVSSSKPFLKKL